MASSKIEDTSYNCVTLSWNRKKAKSVFNDLKEIATSYEVGVDETREFYYRAISTAITNRYWVGKGVKFFEPQQESSPIINEYDVLVPQMNSGNNYLLTVKDTTSQTAYGIRKDNLLLNQAILGFGSELATGITPTTNPVAGTPANMTDGNTATEWDSGTNQLTTHYIDIDLGASKSYLGKIRVDSSSATDKATTFADRFKVLISADGSFAGEETQVYASTEDLGTADKVVIFVPTAGRYIRIQITQAKAAYWQVDEIEVYEWNVADITRWATEKLNERKDPVRRGVLELDSCTKRIWPRGKIRITSKDGTSYYDYPHIGTKIHVGANLKLETKLELGEMAPSIGDELLTQRRMLAEYSIAGLARDADLSSGSAMQGGAITHTHIGKDSVETPMLKALSIIAEKIATRIITADKVVTGSLTATELHLLAATQQGSAYATNQISLTDQGTYQDMSNMSVTITCLASTYVLVLFRGSFGGGVDIYAQLTYEGASITGSPAHVGGSTWMSSPIYGVQQVAAGSRTFKCQWKVPAGTGYVSWRNLLVIELRR